IEVAVGTAGTPIYVSTAGAGYTGNLIDLQANGASKFSVNELGKITGPTTGAFAIDNGNASAINIGNASGAAPINIGTANASTVTIGRAATTTTIGGPLSILGATVTGPTSGTFAIGNGNASAINIGNASGVAPINIGTANASTVTIGRAATTTTIGGPLSILGATVTGPTSGTFAIDNGNASAIN